MRIGMWGGDALGGSVDDFVEAVRRAEQQGFATFWSPQFTSIAGFDALTLLAVVGREVPRIELATSVVPTYPRHPVMLAGQAMTVQACTGGRLTLGIGLSHRTVIERRFGLSYERPARHMREYLHVLMPLVHGGHVSFKGETLTADAEMTLKDGGPVPVMVAALGPKMLELAGGMTEGTITWMTGPITLESHIVPTIRAAAERAGRPQPRIAVGLPVCVTTQASEAHARAVKTFAPYAELASYRAMLDREGVTSPAAVALIGDESSVAEQISRLAEVGATDFIANEFGSPDEKERTRELLQSLVDGRSP